MYFRLIFELTESRMITRKTHTNKRTHTHTDGGKIIIIIIKTHTMTHPHTQSHTLPHTCTYANTTTHTHNHIVRHGDPLVESKPIIRRVIGSTPAQAATYIGTLGKSLTHSCLWCFGVKLRQSIRAVSGATLSSSELEEAL